MVRCAEQGGDPTPRPRAAAPAAAGAGEERSCLESLKEKFGSARLPAGPPAESGGGGGGGRAAGISRARFPWPAAGAPGRAEGRGCEPAGLAERGCPSPQDDAKAPRGGAAGRPTGNSHFQRVLNSWTGCCQSPGASRGPTRGAREPRASAHKWPCDSGASGPKPSNL